MIGVFDSGLGGLTAIRSLEQLLPNEKIIYFGDTGRVPYGTRTRDTVIKYAMQDMRFLASHNVDAVLIACGTVSSTAIDAIRETFGIPVFGVVEPSAERAVKLTKNKIIGVIGTGVTVSSGSFENSIHSIDPEVKVVCEIMPYSGGLNRNIVQCLNDFDIPLLLSHTVVGIDGKDRLTGVTIAEVDANRQPIPGTEIHYDCDTLLLSCGLIPENELTREIGVEMNRVTSGPNVDDKLQTGVPGVFACGNVLHVHDLVDYVSSEAALAGENAAAFVLNTKTAEKTHKVIVKAENGVRYTVPQTIDIENMSDSVTVRFRVGDIYRDRSVCVYYDGKKISSRKKRVLAPGEMEQVVLKKNSFADYPDLSEIVICTEEA